MIVSGKIAKAASIKSGSLAPHSSSQSGARKREQKPLKISDQEIVARLKVICPYADPTKLYHNLVKIGQG